MRMYLQLWIYRMLHLFLEETKSNQPVDDYVNDSRTNQIENDPHGAVFVTKAISLSGSNQFESYYCC